MKTTPIVKSALLASLLNVVLPNPAMFTMDRIKTSAKTF